MFAWLRPKYKCPVDPEVRSWMDERWSWLETEFGVERPRRARVILPQFEFFLDRYDGTAEDAGVMLGRMAGYAELEPSEVELWLYEYRDPIHDARWEPDLLRTEAGQFRVWVKRETLPDPLATSAAFAHELGRIQLMKHGRLPEDEGESGPLADLMAVFLGLGVLTANAVIRENNWRAGGWEGWSMRRNSHLSMTEFGYALARFAMSRDERGEAWSRELRLDARAAFKQSMRHLASPGSKAKGEQVPEIA